MWVAIWNTLGSVSWWLGFANAVCAPVAPKKKKDGEESDGKPYDWAIVLGGTK
jgi:hypothetical protein